MKWLSFFPLLFLMFSPASFVAADDDVIELESEAKTKEETTPKPDAKTPPQLPFKKFGLRVDPLILAIAGNFDFDFYLTPQFSIGPSFIGSGGCGSVGVLSKPQGYECHTWSAIGVRANYYSSTQETRHGVYFGPGIYNVSRGTEYRHSGNNILSGSFTATAISAMVGYAYHAKILFYVGAGGFTFTNKPSEIAVSEGGVQTTISTGSSSLFLWELGLGFRF